MLAPMIDHLGINCTDLERSASFPTTASWASWATAA